MNSALLLGQLALLAALVPTIYLANFYYKAYHAEREKGKRINSMLVWDKYMFVDELRQLVEVLKKTGDKSDLVVTRALIRVVAGKVQLILDGDKRRLAEAKLRVH